MENTFFLNPSMFKSETTLLFQNKHFKMTSFTYASGVQALKIQNKKGYLILLPYMGMIIWDAVFDGISLKMKDMFSEPLLGDNIADTYGCFQFTSGLLANGTPGPEDNYPLHGEFPTSKINKTGFEIKENSLRVYGQKEYVKGFGHHYFAEPSVTMHANSGLFDIELSVTNLSNYQPMPLQYMCHMNYAYSEQGTITQNFPEEAFILRESIPSHVHPTEKWLAYNETLKNSGKVISHLTDSQYYDPEIVFFTKDLTEYVENVEFRMSVGDNQKHHFFTTFKSEQFPIVTRWLLYNADQQVAAFALPGTSRPEGYHAAETAGTLIHLAPHESRHFKVTTGLED